MLESFSISDVRIFFFFALIAALMVWLYVLIHGSDQARRDSTRMKNLYEKV